jgi:hypothetical protein
LAFGLSSLFYDELYKFKVNYRAAIALKVEPKNGILI